MLLGYRRADLIDRLGLAPTAEDRVVLVLATGRVEGLNLACTWNPGRPGLQELRGQILADLLAV
jgi:hypothetical protein